MQAREDALRAQLAQQVDTQSTVKTDLAPSDVAGQKRVLLGV